MTSRHFHVPAASEMLFEAAQACPFYGGLTFDGLAIEPAPDGDRLHLIVSTGHPAGGVRAYLGPDAATVARRGLLLVTALARNPAAPLPTDRAAQVLEWIAWCWESATGTVADLAAPRRGEVEPGH